MVPVEGINREKRGNYLEKVEMAVEGNILIIKVDLTKDFGPSSSKKSIIIASTEGNVSVPNAAGEGGAERLPHEVRRRSGYEAHPPLGAGVLLRWPSLPHDLGEHRTALISVTVTGKIDVREEVT